MLSVPWLTFAVTHLRLFICLQESKPVKKPVVEEYGDDLYADLYDDLSVSTVTVGPNVTEYEVGLSKFIKCPHLSSKTPRGCFCVH